MLEPYAEGTADLDIALLRARDDNASAQSEFVEEGIFAGQTELTATLNGWEPEEGECVATLTLNHAVHKDGWFTGDMEALPQNGYQADLASTLLHEMAHALGIYGSVSVSEDETPRFDDVPNLWTDGLRDIDGRQARPSMTIVTESEAEELLGQGESRSKLFVTLGKQEYGNQAGVDFTGENVAEVLGGATLS